MTDDIANQDESGQRNHYFDMTGKTVVVTGGSRGLGLEMVRGFAKMGANVVSASRKLEACEVVASEIRAMGVRALALAFQASAWDDMESFVDACLQEYGSIDVLVNNAGFGPATPESTEVGESLFDKIFSVNVKGPFRLTALVGNHMRGNNGGSIINISSTASARPKAETSVYAAAKNALNAITKSHALEFGPTVRVNGILCGPFWTDISKSWREQADRDSIAAVGRIGRAHEIVTTALYLASPASSFTTGSLITLDGGIP